MIYEIHLGAACETADLGDVVFWVLDASGKAPRYQHAGLCYRIGPFPIRSVSERVKVLEAEGFTQAAEWPNESYCVQVVGQMRIRGTQDRQLSIGERVRIVRVGEKIVWRRRHIVDVLKRPARDCQWAKKPYKYIAPDPSSPESAIEMHFTCATFVEFCYERAGFDIIKDGDHGEYLPVVDWGGEPLPRLFPGYLIKAFKDDRYPLDLQDLNRRGEDPRLFRVYPFEG